MILADAVTNHSSAAATAIRLSAPPLELAATCFAAGILAKLVGAWGVYAGRIRCISVFIAVNLLLAIRKPRARARHAARPPKRENALI
jgi:hypothetical protein